MTVTLGFDVEEFDFPLERGRGIDFGTQLAVMFSIWQTSASSRSRLSLL